MIIKITKNVYGIFIRLVMVLAGAWASAALYFSRTQPGIGPQLGITAALIFCVILFFVRPLLKKSLWFAVVFLPILIWFFFLPPQMDADWQPDVARLPSVDVHGDELTFHNIRNFDYRSETDYRPQYYDQTYDLSKLRSVDLYLSYWGSPDIAHTISSFGFEGDKYLAVSVETRKTIGQSYSAVRGFFKAYELIYVVGDERDLIRLRTNYRKEQVYIYRINRPIEWQRRLLLSYVASINQLARAPQWYNAMINNCTTNIFAHTPAYNFWKLFNPNLLMTGHLDRLIYANGRMSRELPFAELKARSCINAAAEAADQAEDFSVQIRKGRPAMGQGG